MKAEPMTELPAGEILALTAKIVSAHASHNHTTADALPALIRTVFQTLAGVGVTETRVEAPAPAVPIKKSVSPDYIVCLEDGKKLKMLKRHLQASYSMTPEAYRAKWGLPSDYPMTAPNYAKRRSELAKTVGLGRKPSPEPPVSKIPARRAKGSRG